MYETYVVNTPTRSRNNVGAKDLEKTLREQKKAAAMKRNPYVYTQDGGMDVPLDSWSVLRKNRAGKPVEWLYPRADGMRFTVEKAGKKYRLLKGKRNAMPKLVGLYKTPTDAKRAAFSRRNSNGDTARQLRWSGGKGSYAAQSPTHNYRIMKVFDGWRVLVSARGKQPGARSQPIAVVGDLATAKRRAQEHANGRESIKRRNIPMSAAEVARRIDDGLPNRLRHYTEVYTRKVVGAPSVAVIFARTNDRSQLARLNAPGLQIDIGDFAPSRLEGGVGGDASTKVDKVTVQTFRSRGVPRLRKRTTTPDKAVDYVVKWFKKNEAALMGTVTKSKNAGTSSKFPSLTATESKILSLSQDIDRVRSTLSGAGGRLEVTPAHARAALSQLDVIDRKVKGLRGAGAKRIRDDSKFYRAKAKKLLGAKTSRKNAGKTKRNARSPFDNMAWHSDPLVRDIYSEVDDRGLADVAAAIMEVYQNYDRNIRSGKATSYLTQEESADAAIMASNIVDWANYAEAYGDYSDPPWRRRNRKGTRSRNTKRKKASMAQRNKPKTAAQKRAATAMKAKSKLGISLKEAHKLAAEGKLTPSGSLKKGASAPKARKAAKKKAAKKAPKKRAAKKSPAKKKARRPGGGASLPAKKKTAAKRKGPAKRQSVAGKPCPPTRTEVSKGGAKLRTGKTKSTRAQGGRTLAREKWCARVMRNAMNLKQDLL